MTLTLIAAMDEDGAIGRASGGLPWHLPDETAHFRAYCQHKWLLIGRRTFEEMAGWFQPGHHLLVLSRNPLPPVAHAAEPSSVPIQRVDTVAEAVQAARRNGAKELVTLGGARVFAETLPAAHRLVLSRIHLHSGGEVRFPEIDRTSWHRTEVSRTHRDTTTGITFTIECWKRHTPPPNALT